MQWENLTSLDFAKAVADCQGVGIIAVGVVEPHASHLPLGTDMFIAHWTALQAARQEAAIVFPAYPYGINTESAHLPGSVVIRREVVFALLENICDEMGRHGIKKIILFSGHGGNRYFLPLFVQTLPEKEKDYVAYYVDLPLFPQIQGLIESEEVGHACEVETSMLLAIHEELVKRDQIPSRPFLNLKRNQALAVAGAYSPVDWYAMYPAMYVGDAGYATIEKGRQILERHVELLVDLIRAVKADTVTAGLLEEFHAGKREPKVPEAWA